MRKVIIVCDEKRREFADYLSQLVSLSDDTDDATVGVKDGTVATQVWLEKSLSLCLIFFLHRENSTHFTCYQRD